MSCCAIHKTVTFLFGRQPSESAMLQAGVLATQLEAAGWHVVFAATAAPARHLLGHRFARRIEVAPGLPGLLSRWLPYARRRRDAVPCLGILHAWDAEAALRAPSPGPGRARLCVTLSELDQIQRLTDAWAWRRYARGGAIIFAAAAPVACPRRAGPAEVVPAPIVVDPDLPRLRRSRRQQARAVLGLRPAETPVFAIPPPARHPCEPVQAVWAACMLRKANVPARLVLPEMTRQTARAMRFAATCHEDQAVVLAPPATPWSDILAAADAVVVPARRPVDPVPVVWAMAAGLPVLAVDGSMDPALLAGQACLLAPDHRPIMLARYMLRLHEDRALAESLSANALAWADRELRPASAWQVYPQAYRAGQPAALEPGQMA